MEIVRTIQMSMERNLFKPKCKHCTRIPLDRILFLKQNQCIDVVQYYNYDSEH